MDAMETCYTELMRRVAILGKHLSVPFDTGRRPKLPQGCCYPGCGGLVPQGEAVCSEHSDALVEWLVDTGKVGKVG